MDGALADRIGQLVGHRSQMLAGSEQDDPTILAIFKVGGGEGLGEEDRGARVDRPGPIELLRRDRRQRLIGVAGVVDDERVDRPESVDRRLDYPAWRLGVTEVGLDV